MHKMEEASMMDSLSVTTGGSTTGTQQQQTAGTQGVPYDLVESGYDMEPQQRARSNTWPLPRPEGYVEAGNAGTGVNATPGKEVVEGGTPPQQPGINQTAGLLPVKKNSSRRNAWGNLSYADLITQAITSAPEQRLTLSQIYEWMVQNVAYFKDKGDSTSSAGWKNSIRHNLSLHSRFMRVQNEGTGKSSWWMINRDAKQGKPARRRATSMEANKFEKRRGRVKKKVEAIRNAGLQADAIPSPSSSVSEGLDLFPDSPLHPASGFQLSPDFRPRASSNASSCGRLSPIPAVIRESDWTPEYVSSSYSPEQLDSILAGSLAETMKLEPYQMYHQTPSLSQQQQQQQQQQQTGPPPSYYESQYQSLRAGSSSYQQRCPIHRLQSCTCQVNPSPVSGMSPSYQQNDASPTTLGANQQQTLQYMLLQHTQQRQQQQQQRQPQTGPAGPSPPNTPTPCDPSPSTMMGQIMGALNPQVLDDLNITETLRDFGCNVEELIKHELSMEETLDFNFQQGVMSTAEIQVSNANIVPSSVATPQNHVVGTAANNPPAGVYVSSNATTPAAPPSWVH